MVDVITVGSAIVDLLGHSSDAMLEELGLTKGSMRLVDADEAQVISSALDSWSQMPGGSSANTAVNLATMGAAVAFLGKTGLDDHGAFHRECLAARNVTLLTTEPVSHRPSAHSLIIVTPDGQRTMSTHLGAAEELGPDDIVESRFPSAKILHIEGYLLDFETSRRLALRLIELAIDCGVALSISLADSLCVERHRPLWNEILNKATFVFGNDLEFMTLTGRSSAREAVQEVSGLATTAVATLGADGCVFGHASSTKVVPTAKRVPLDSTGAGDAFTAGFLYGVLNGQSPLECAELGNAAGGAAVSHLGAHPEIRP